VTTQSGQDSIPPPGYDQASDSTGEMIRRIIAVFAVAALAGGCLMVLAPFAVTLLWGAILGYCTWTPYVRLSALLGGRRGLAAGLLVLLFMLVLIAPFVYAGANLVSHADSISETVRNWIDNGLPQPPDWITGMPVAGSAIRKYWEAAGSNNPDAISELRKLAAPAAEWLLSSGASVASGIIQMIFSVLVTFFFYTGGNEMAAMLSAGVRRIAGAKSAHLLELAGKTIKGVVYGILGTALAQGVLAGFGFWISGVPAAGVLGLVTFFLSVVPMGPVLIWGPAALWLYHEGSAGWAIFIVVWGIAVVSMADNIIKPLLISKGSAMPFILVMIGVMGGAFAFGFLGVFTGPTLLAVGYAMLRDWTDADSADSGEGL